MTMRDRRLLDQFFDPKAGVATVLAALRALGRESSGEVMRRDGLFCDRVFGSDNLGRLSRWGHITVAVPLLHPRLVTRIADLLGLAESEIRELHATEDDFSERLADLLDDEHDDELAAAGFSPRDLLFDRVPVVPYGERLPLVSAQLESAQQRLPVFAADNRAYAAVLELNEKLAYLCAAKAPPFLITAQTGALQQAFDELYRIFASPVGSHTRRRISHASQPAMS